MDLALLYKEKLSVSHQFPTVRAADDPPSTYDGYLRCQMGEVKALADKGIWPFTEYAQWNGFRLELPSEYPIKPPVATWLSHIAHPNIVPTIPSAVCVSILGGAWRPSLRLASVLNALNLLLADPNPENVFDHPACLKAATVCRQYGFPKMVKRPTRDSSDVLKFRILPVPAAAAVRGDVARFRVLDVSSR